MVSGKIRLSGEGRVYLVGLFPMLLFGFTFEAISSVHIFRLVVSAIDVHRIRVQPFLTMSSRPGSDFER